MMKEFLMWDREGCAEEMSDDALLLGVRKEVIYGAFTSIRGRSKPSIHLPKLFDII
jgi:hypothetical protein